MEGYGSEVGLVGSFVPRPPPIAPTPAVSESLGCERTQSLRQFANAALQAAQGDGYGYHTPRSSGGISGRFDSEGYPLSPGGTSIKPPAGPPPVSARATGSPASVPAVSAGNPGLPVGVASVGDPAASGASLGVVLDQRNPGIPAGHCGVPSPSQGNVPGFFGSGLERPEEPAKYISELPKLV